MADLTGSIFVRTTTLTAVHAAGILLCEEPDASAPLRVICTVIPNESTDLVHVGFAVQVELAGRWIDVMANLAPGDDDDANVARAEALFGATSDEEREMLRLAIGAARADAIPLAHRPRA